MQRHEKHITPYAVIKLWEKFKKWPSSSFF